MTSEPHDPELEKFLAQPRDAIRTCPDCETELRSITLIDSGDLNVQQKLGYAMGVTERRSFTGRFKEAGKVNARMCPGCGRIILYADC